MKRNNPKLHWLYEAADRISANIAERDAREATKQPAGPTNAFNHRNSYSIFFTKKIPLAYVNCRPSRQGTPELYKQNGNGANGAFIHGTYQSGKSHNAAALAWARLTQTVKLETDFSGRAFVPDNALFWAQAKKYTESYRNARKGQFEAIEFTKSAEKAAILVLDDIEPDDADIKYYTSSLFDLFSIRMAQMRYTIVTSSRSLEQINVWSTGMGSRLSTFTQIILPPRSLPFVDRTTVMPNG